MDTFVQFLSDHGLRILDILGAVVGLVYLYLEYHASIYLWFASIIMPLIDMWLYWEAGLYADFGMAIYYALAAVYGFVMWKFVRVRRTKTSEGEADAVRPIRHTPRHQVKWIFVVFSLLWWGIYELLIHFTNSSVPVTDSLSSALSIIALWALAQKYLEQWILWFFVDAICFVLYLYKDIPFKAMLYGLYVVMAVLGYFKWKRMMKDSLGERRLDH